MPARSAVGGLGGTAVVAVDGFCVWALAFTAATTGDAAGAAAGAAGVAAGAAAGAAGVTPASEGVRAGGVADVAGAVVAVVAPATDRLRRSPDPPPARVRLAPAPDAGLTVPAAAAEVAEPVVEGSVAGPTAAPEAPVGGVSPEDGVDGSGVDEDAAPDEDEVEVGDGADPWTATTLAAEVVGDGLPCTAKATPTAAATWTTTVAPRTLRACTPGSGPSPTSHRSHCLKA
jgi:hypothetical protein